MADISNVFVSSIAQTLNTAGIPCVLWGHYLLQAHGVPNYEVQSWAMEDLYSAVASATSIKLFMAYVAIKNLKWEKFDFVTAFLNSKIPEDTKIFVRPPPGFEREDGQVWLVKKGMYGLRRAPLWWFETITPFLKDLGFIPFEADLCLFINNKTGVVIVLYVDDFLIAADTDREIDNLATSFEAKFNIKKLGVPTKFLGFNIIRDENAGTIFLSQEEFTVAMLAKYGFESRKTAKTPWPPGFELPQTWTPLPKELKLYQKRSGSLNWLSVGTRPDISYAVNKAAKGNAGPSEQHIHLQHHIFRYIEKTKALGIIFNGRLPMDNIMKVYADASWADDTRERRSTAGYIVFVAGAPVLWKSKLQTLVTLSTTEAEFVNLTPAGQAAIWLCRFVKEFGIDIPRPIILFTDSLNARHNVLNKNNSARTRHIDIRYKWIIQRTQHGDFHIKHIETDKMAADGLTKPLEATKFEIFKQLLGLVHRSIFQGG